MTFHKNHNFSAVGKKNMEIFIIFFPKFFKKIHFKFYGIIGNIKCVLFYMALWGSIHHLFFGDYITKQDLFFFEKNIFFFSNNII